MISVQYITFNLFLLITITFNLKLCQCLILLPNDAKMQKSEPLKTRDSFIFSVSVKALYSKSHDSSLW